MKRKDMTEVERLQDKEQSLKRKGKFYTVLIGVLALVSIVLIWQSYTGRRDSWLFQEVLKTGSLKETSQEAAEQAEEEPESAEESEEEPELVEENQGGVPSLPDESGKMVLKNVAKQGSTNYIFRVKESGWQMFESGLLSGDDAVEVDLCDYVGGGSTEVVETIEYYGQFGNLVESEEKTLKVTK